MKECCGIEEKLQEQRQDLQHPDAQVKFLIEKKWWDSWCKYVQYAVKEGKEKSLPEEKLAQLKPGPIVNSRLVLDKGELNHDLNKNLLENVDYLSFYNTGY
jgi:hypothetical protein